MTKGRGFILKWQILLILISLLFLANLSLAKSLPKPLFKKEYSGYWFVGLGGSIWGGVDTGATNPNKVTVQGQTYNLSVSQATVLKIFGGYLFQASPRFFWGPELSILSPSKNKNEYSANNTTYLSYSSNSVGFLLDTKYYIKPMWYVGLDVGVAYVRQTVKTGYLIKTDQGNYRKSALKPEVEFSTGLQVDQNVAFHLSYEYRLGDKPDPFAHFDESKGFIITEQDKQIAPFNAVMIGVTFDFL